MHELGAGRGAAQVRGEEAAREERRGARAALPRVVLVPAQRVVVAAVDAAIVGREEDERVVPEAGVCNK